MGAEGSKGLSDNSFGCCQNRKSASGHPVQTRKEAVVKEVKIKRGVPTSLKNANGTLPERASALMDAAHPNVMNRPEHGADARFVSMASMSPDKSVSTASAPGFSTPRQSRTSQSSPNANYSPGRSSPSSPLLQKTSNRVGVGAYFQKCAFDSKCLEVRAILPGGPVEHNGCIEVGDILLEVDGTDMYGKGMAQVVPILLGEESTEVKMSFAKPGAFKGQPPASLTALNDLVQEKVEVVLKRGTQVDVSP